MDCLHTSVDLDYTCLECGTCNASPIVVEHAVRYFQTQGDERRLKYFMNVLDIIIGRPSINMDNKLLLKIKNTAFKLYGDFNSKQLSDVLLKLKLHRFVPHTNSIYNTIFSIGVNIEILQYEHYLMYMWNEMFKKFIKIYPHNYFINGKLMCSLLLKEVNVNYPFTFKNISTLRKQHKLFYKIRPMVDMNYIKFNS